MSLQPKVVLVSVAIVALGIAAAFPSEVLVPVREGTAADYWAAAAGAHRKGILGGPNACLTLPVDGYFFYSSQHLHGAWYYRAPESEVLEIFPKTTEEFDAPDKMIAKWTSSGFRAWEEADAARSDPKLLLLNLREARVAYWAKQDLLYGRQLVELEDFSFGLAYHRMRLFPLVQLGEWAYLSALFLFAAWPWMRNQGLASWTIHAAFLPLLLLLPYYLGHCGWAFTSAGPIGGVVYPYILPPLRDLPWTALDKSIVEQVPQVLAPFSGPIGPMLSMSGGRRAGPVGAVGLGIALGAVTCLLGLWIRRQRRSTSRVLNTEIRSRN